MVVHATSFFFTLKVSIAKLRGMTLNEAGKAGLVFSNQVYSI